MIPRGDKNRKTSALPPERIYLQWYGTDELTFDPNDMEAPDPNDVTWCQNRINDSDYEYRLVKRSSRRPR